MARQSQPQFQSSMYHYLRVYVQGPGPVTKPQNEISIEKINKKGTNIFDANVLDTIGLHNV